MPLKWVISRALKKKLLEFFLKQRALAGIKALFIRQEVWALKYMLKSAKKKTPVSDIPQDELLVGLCQDLDHSKTSLS